jgi:hypothetical protein
MKLLSINFGTRLNVLNTYLLLGLLLLPVFSLMAQPLPTGQDRSKPWYVPHQANLQFAGNLGLFSGGLGYTLFRQKLQIDLLYGYTPRFQAEKGLHALTLKAAYHPFRKSLNHKYFFEPFKIGTGFNYAFGSQFFTSLPDRYPDNYYWWSSSLRFTPFIGTTLIRQIGKENRVIKNIQVYTELGTHDLAIVSWLTNKNLAFGKVLNLALGIKMGFR